MKQTLFLIALLIGFMVCQADNGKAPPGNQVTYLDESTGGSIPFNIQALEADVYDIQAPVGDVKNAGITFSTADFSFYRYDVYSAGLL